MKNEADSDKLEYVDALRGIAILLVILFHVGLELQIAGHQLSGIFKGGQYGVQLFYVASAFTLCLSHARRRSEPYPLSRFFFRRFFRIAPIYYAGMLFYFAIRSTAAQQWLPAGYDASSILANLTFTHGLQPQWINFVVPGGWSIACEMMFYLLLPLLLSWVVSWRSAAVCLGLAIVANMAAAWLSFQPQLQSWREIEPSFFYFWLPNQLPVFAAGLLTYYIYQEIQKVPAARRALLACGAWLGFALLSVVAAYCLFSRVFGPYSHCVMPILCGLCFGMLMLGLALYPVSLLVNRVTRTFGLYSYGGYITHFAIVWLMMEVGVPNWFPRDNRFAAWLACSALVAGFTLLAAKGVNVLIEQPGIQLGRFMIRHYLTPEKATETNRAHEKSTRFREVIQRSKNALRKLGHLDVNQ